jgi:putative hemolysin
MSLINPRDFSKATNLEKLKLDILSEPLMKLLKISDINDIYSRYGHLQRVEWLGAVLDDLQVTYQIDEKDLANIPKEGPFICIANHPYGGIDGLMLLRIFCEQRSDFKIMANFLLQKIKNIEEFVLPVNPFDNAEAKQESLRGIKQTLAHLKEGHAIGIFPAGEVSAFQTDSKKIEDKPWQPMIGKLVAKANVPVVPVHFSGTNSNLFNLLGMIHPKFRTVKLPSELFNKKGSVIKVRIGRPISQKTIKQFPETDRLVRYLRARTYAIGSPLEVKKFFLQNPFTVNKKAEEVIPETPAHILETEINMLVGTPNHLFSHENFDAFISTYKKIPNILTEIGRLREITFREVGEGTNKNIDTDEFDLYYHHLFLWDREAKKVVGAYRVGKGNDIYRKFKKDGFYISTLFKIKRGFIPIMRQSMELGRSFIRKEYQQKHLPLFLLWRGILIFIQSNKFYRYLMGPVSISNNFSNISKALIIEFIKKHFFNHEFAKFIEPRTEFSFDPEDIDSDILLNSGKTDIKDLDQLISEIEPFNYRVPVLMKKYLKQDAKILGFNIDPKFGNALDGFMIMDIKNVPDETVKMLQ